MEQISSSLTLFLKIVFPTFWFIFFGLFGLGAVFLNDDTNVLLASSSFQIGYFALFFIFGSFIYITLMQLQRIDMDDHNTYISNYFKTYRYDYQSIMSISTQNWLLCTVGIIELKDKGKLGKKIRFLVRKKVFSEFTQKYPSIFKSILTIS